MFVFLRGFQPAGLELLCPPAVSRADKRKIISVLSVAKQILKMHMALINKLLLYQ